MEWLAAIAGWLYFALVIVMVVTAVTRRREPAAALGWSLAIVFLPGIGILFFLLFGLNHMPRRLRRKIEHHESFTTGFARPGGGRSEIGPTPEMRRWAPVSRSLERLDDRPRRTGNACRLLDDGEEAFRAMVGAIRAAKQHVHVEFYIFRNDELGRKAQDLLVEKCREGVEVRVLVDAVGSMGNRVLVKRIRAAGGKAARFLPLRPFGKRITPNLRNHRKLVVCDGRVAFFGGLNVGVEYLGRRWRRGSGAWFDLHMRLEGPSVWDLQSMFAEDWDFSTQERLEGAAYFPDLEPAGEVPVQIVCGGPDQAVNAVHEAFFAGIVRARERIRLLTPYFVPDKSLRDALTSAARTGVQVEVLLPRPPGDSWLVHHCARYFAADMVRAGVTIREYEPGMMHAKAMVVDGRWGLIGTANLDNRSLALNFEQMAVVDGRAHVRDLDETLKRALAQGTELTLEHLAQRPAGARLLSAFVHLLAPLL